MKARDCAFLAAIAAILVACRQGPSHPAIAIQPRLKLAPVEAGYKRAYQYRMGAKRIDFEPDKNLLVETVDVAGPARISNAMTTSGYCWELKLYDGGVVTFADGQTKKYRSLTLVYDPFSEEQPVAVETH